MSDWIDVKQELPEDGVRVIVWCPYWMGTPFTAYRRFGEWHGEHILSEQGEVLAWIPLPEPPK